MLIQNKQNEQRECAVSRTELKQQPTVCCMWKAPAQRMKRRGEERITRPKRRKFIIWNRGILTSYLFLCVRHARLALTNLKLIGNSFRTLRGNFKIFGNLFGTLPRSASSLWNFVCAFFYSVTKLSSCFFSLFTSWPGLFRVYWLAVVGAFSLCPLFIGWIGVHLSFVIVSLFSPSLHFRRHLIYSFGFRRDHARYFGYFHAVINRICQLNAGTACVTFAQNAVISALLSLALLSHFGPSQFEGLKSRCSLLHPLFCTFVQYHLYSSSSSSGSNRLIIISPWALSCTVCCLLLLHPTPHHYRLILSFTLALTCYWIISARKITFDCCIFRPQNGERTNKSWILPCVVHCEALQPRKCWQIHVHIHAFARQLHCCCSGAPNVYFALKLHTKCKMQDETEEERKN